MVDFVTGLRCRECARSFPAEALHVCDYCFGPLEVAYDYERIAATVGKHNIADVRFGWIENTLELSSIALSDNMRSEILSHPALEIVEESHELPFDAEGNLPFDVFTREAVAVH